MTDGSNERLGQIEAILTRSIIASDERMTRIEQSMAASDGRLTRIENLVESNHRESNERLTRIEQIVESSNKFLESFSTDLRRYTNSMNDFATRIDGVIGTNNQDRLKSNSRLQVIQRQVSAIARHLGVI